MAKVREGRMLSSLRVHQQPPERGAHVDVFLPKVHQRPTNNREHVKLMLLFRDPKYILVNMHKMMIECRPAAQEPMKPSRFFFSFRITSFVS